MITGYSSQEATDAADAEFARKYFSQLAELQDSKILRQVDGLDVKDVPVDVEKLILETIIVKPGEEVEFEEAQKRGIGESLHQAEKVVGGWDTWTDVQRRKRGEKPVKGVQMVWMEIRACEGWDDLDVAGRKDDREGDRIVLRKIMG